jgi:hypothetical protein
MYIPVVLTERYRVIQMGQLCQDIEEAKKAARELLLEQGQMPAVLDECKVVQWKGGIKAATDRRKLLLDEGQMGASSSTRASNAQSADAIARPQSARG